MVTEILLALTVLYLITLTLGDWPAKKSFEFFEACELAGLRMYHKERNGWGCGGNRCIEVRFRMIIVRTFCL